MENPKNPKKPTYFCEKCNFTSSHKNDYSKHLQTIKHIHGVNGTQKTQKNPETPSKTFICSCGRQYKTYSGLWKHSQLALTCKTQAAVSLENPVVEEPKDKEETSQITIAILELIKQNNDLRNLVIEQNKNNVISFTDISKHITTELINAVKSGYIGNNTIHNTLNNTNNSFNLNFFLNETCKDALNISEFIENIKITNADLEETARLGYSGGISRIFLNELNSLDITKKPIHCSDAKREIIYIKDNNVWEKDDEYKSKLVKAVKQTARKNYMRIFEWEKEYPQCKKDPDSKMGKLYNKIIINSMSGGSNAEQIDNVNKIVKIIIRNSIIDKNLLYM